MFLLAIIMAASAEGRAARLCAERALFASARAYREVPALRDTMEYLLEAPGAEREPKKIEYGFGAGKDVWAADALLKVVAVGSTMFVTRSDDSLHYLAVPYAGRFGASLQAVSGEQGSLFEPPPVAMRTGQDFSAWMEALRFKQLGPLRIASCDGERIEFVADNGRLDLRLDRKTRFFAAATLELRPLGSPADFRVRIEARFSPQVLASGRGVARFDPGGRTAVRSLAELGANKLNAGAPAPEFTLTTLDGRAVTLRDLRGSVVVLDFWATWCAPCWNTLRETQALRDWVAAEHLPVAVFAVNSLEHLPTARERKERAGAFWTSQGFSMPSLLDSDDAVFGAFGTPGLPSIVVVTPDGSVAALHSGAFPNVLATLQAEVRAALARK